MGNNDLKMRFNPVLQSNIYQALEQLEGKKKYNYGLMAF